MSKRFIKHYKVARALMANDSRLASLGNRSQRAKIAHALVKMAVDAQALKAIGPLLAQQFIIGAGGEYDLSAVKSNPEKFALQTLRGSMNLDPRQARTALKDVETSISTKLEKIYNTFASSFGLNALEEAYTNLVLNQEIYKASWESGITTLEGLKNDAGKLIASVMRNDMLDHIKVEKGRRNLERDLTYIEDDLEEFDGDTVLSSQPSPQMARAILEIIEGGEGNRHIVNHAQSALKIRGADDARKFAGAVRSCGALHSGKFSAGAKNDLLALCVVLPYTKKLKGSDRRETLHKVLQYVMKEAFDHSKGMITGAGVRGLLTESRVPAQDPDGLAKAINGSSDYKFLAKNAMRYIDASYAELVRILVKMTAGIETNMGADCDARLAELSDKVELEKLRKKLEIPRSVKWETR